ncbi:hypothetical protein BDY17DRAFT_325684 [Neohortaea acidophila]|uniref:Uncharacterized protein n=1 Tax=Neohortaea acidophila TaxID=245834 RepID=A0A6A6PNW5_9PEZI|nr:uncharacterized protein BDY17DRAFT_325684 [Neohortaea acidophila]KAF2480957.1 hypothetical protein BDY17DRAFT_325684 [Neohortaea acidophila]
MIRLVRRSVHVEVVVFDTTASLINTDDTTAIQETPGTGHRSATRVGEGPRDQLKATVDATGESITNDSQELINSLTTKKIQLETELFIWKSRSEGQSAMLEWSTAKLVKYREVHDFVLECSIVCKHLRRGMAKPATERKGSAVNDGEFGKRLRDRLALSGAASPQFDLSDLAIDEVDDDALEKSFNTAKEEWETAEEEADDAAMEL